MLLRTRRSPPKQLTYPDWSNPLTKGMVMLIQPGFQLDVSGKVPLADQGLRQILQPEHCATNNGDLYTDGSYTTTAGIRTTPGVWLGDGAFLGTMAQSSLVCIASMSPQSSFSGSAAGAGVVDNNGDAIYCERAGPTGTDIYKIGASGALLGGATMSPGVEFTYRTDDNSLLQLRVSGVPAYNDGFPHFYAQTKDGAAHVVWFDEATASGTFPGANQTMTEANFSRHIGGDPADAQCHYYGITHLVAGWNRVLSDRELASIRANPWQLFAKVRGVSPPITPSVSVQTVYPASDISAGNWTPSTGISLYATINESPASDVQYDSTPNASTMVVKLQSASSPGVTTGHAVNYRCKGAGILTVDLMQGATVIATWTHNPAPAVYTTFAQAVTSLQAANITDYTDLRLRFAAS